MRFSVSDSAGGLVPMIAADASGAKPQAVTNKARRINDV
jgi:hypothetical protein